MSVFRFKLVVEYAGGDFVGFQRQKEHTSVQGALEEVLSFLNRAPVCLYGAGRTDAGVHASGQVCHVDLQKEWDCHRLLRAINFYLHGKAVAVLQVERVDHRFHARFSAVGRSYVYTICQRPAPPILWQPYVWHVPVKLNTEAMVEGARLMEGDHDFNSFRSRHCQAKISLRTLTRLKVVVHGELILIQARATSFLHNQVRIMVGGLHSLGTGYWKPSDVLSALEAKDRVKGPQTAPPQGLCLTHVSYCPKEWARGEDQEDVFFKKIIPY